jgi:isocitrate dehydrogenase
MRPATSTAPTNTCPRTPSRRRSTYGVAIKGPLTTPIGGGIRSLNVALRQIFRSLLLCASLPLLRGNPQPHKRPQDLDVIVYRENTEDIYMGIEWEASDPVGIELIRHLNETVIPANGKLGNRQIPAGSGIGIKPVSKNGSQRHIRKAIQHALKLEGDKRHVTLVHKGNIMKFTEGAFRDWGYELATSEFRDVCITERESWILGNLEADPGLSIEANARLIEPGYDALTPRRKKRSMPKFRGFSMPSAPAMARASGNPWCWSTTASPTAFSNRSRPGPRSIRCSPPSTSMATM